MASSTGRVIYLATNNGIYAYSIMSNGTLNPVTANPQVSGSYNQIAVTPGTPSGSTTPLLLATTTTSTTVITTWPLNGNGTVDAAGAGSIAGSCTTGGTYTGTVTGIAVAPDDQYVVAVDGTHTTTDNVATLPLPGTTGCTTASSSASYPVQPSFDCAVPGTSNCLLFLTLSSTAVANPTPAAPLEFTWSTGTLAASTPSLSCAAPACPLGAAFNPDTLFFYVTENGTSPPSVQSVAPDTATSTATASFSSSSPLNYPCVDSLGQTAYIPTANGYLYSVSTGTSGAVGSPQAVLTPTTTGSSATLDIYSCAVSNSP